MSVKSVAGSFLTAIGHNLRNWKVEYLLIPATPFILILLAKFVYFLTGRPPSENADALIGLGFRILDIAVIIIAISLTKEAVGHWYTKAELIKTPMLAFASTLTTIAFGALFTYLLTH